MTEITDSMVEDANGAAALAGWFRREDSLADRQRVWRAALTPVVVPLLDEISRLEAENEAVDAGHPAALVDLLHAIAAGLPEQTVDEQLADAERAYRRVRRIAMRATRRVEGLVGAVDALTSQLAETRARVAELTARAVAAEAKVAQLRGLDAAVQESRAVAAEAMVAELEAQTGRLAAAGASYMARAAVAEAQAARVRALAEERRRDYELLAPIEIMRILGALEPTSNSPDRLEAQVEGPSEVGGRASSVPAPLGRCGWICDLRPGHKGDHAASLGHGLAEVRWPQSANLPDRPGAQ